MIPNSRRKDFQAKQEGGINDGNFFKTTSTSRQWAGFKNPRIVRVSRSFGGKDRHSKVCTIKGLRDRRIRLSVPTAIQLYDLQDKLGLNQPSKVVDWLLDATKHEIDQLPPLQIPPEGFSQFHQATSSSRETTAPQYSLSSFFDVNQAYFSKQGIKINDLVDTKEQIMTNKLKYWVKGATAREISKEVEGETVWKKNKCIAKNEPEYQVGTVDYNASVSAQNFFPIENQSSLSAFLNNAGPYNFYNNWDPSSVPLSHFGSQGVSLHMEEAHNSHSISLPSSLALSSGSQLFIFPATTSPSIYAQYPPPYMNTSMEGDSRQINHFQLSSSNSQNILPHSLISSLHSVSPQMKSFPFNVNPKVFHSQENSHADKGNSGSHY